jgi:hypothetical protein
VLRQTKPQVRFLIEAGTDKDDVSTNGASAVINAAVLVRTSAARRPQHRWPHACARLHSLLPVNALPSAQPC